MDDAGRRGSSVIAVQPIAETGAPSKAEKDALLLDESRPAASAAEEQKPALVARRKAASPPPAVAPPPPPPPPAPVAAEALATEIIAEPEQARALPADKEAEPFPLKQDGPQAAGASGVVGERKDADRRNQAPSGDVGVTRAKSLANPDAVQSRAPAPTSSVQLRQNMRLPAEDWLAEIVRLKREGHRQQAIENLRLFRRMHPDWQLSDELLRLAQ